jgi:hypothetical protein
MSCPVPHAIRAASGVGFAPELDVLGSYATDTWLRCRLCGAMFWTVEDDGKYGYSGQWELDAALAHAALVEHDARALARLFVSMSLPMGPVWDFTAALVGIFRALTPTLTDAERAHAIEEAGPSARWSKASLVLSVESNKNAATELSHFPIDLRLAGARFREWFEVGGSLVLITDKPEVLRLEPRGMTRFELGAVPHFLAQRDDRLMLAVGDTALLVLDAKGQAWTWEVPGAVTADALDEGWWLLVPDDGNAERAIELRLPDGDPRVRFARRFAPAARWMSPPRRFDDGWIITNLVDVEGATQALTLFDPSFHMVAASAACAPADRRVTPIDATSFWAEIDGAMERWVREGKTLELAETFAARASWWTGGRLVTNTREGVVTARGGDGKVEWTWKRETFGATYGVVVRGGILLYDHAHAHWLDFEGRVRRTFDVESPDVRVAKGGTVYMKTLAELWIIDEDARAVVVGTEAKLETTCGDDALLRCRDGTCLLVTPAGLASTFTAKGAWFPVGGTRSGPWLVEGDRIRGTFGRSVPTAES